MLDYEHTPRGWEVFDAVSGSTHAVLPYAWLARLVCAVSDRLR